MTTTIAALAADYQEEYFDEQNAAELRCSVCNRELTEGAVEEMIAFLEHCLFDHVSRCDFYVVSYESGPGAYEMAETLGLAPLTEHETNWRAEHGRA